MNLRNILTLFKDMDWKDILQSKINSGELERDESIEESSPSAQSESCNLRDALHVVTERKGRKGKTATIVYGFTCDEQSLAQIAAKIKSRLGTGGSSRGGEILIQGDVAEKVKIILKELGYRLR